MVYSPCRLLEMLHHESLEPSPLIREQAVLFSPTLDAVISEDHSVRLVDEVMRQMDWSAWEQRYCLVAGQPPIHPRIVAGAILYGLTLGKGPQIPLADPDARVLPNKQGGYAPNYTPVATTETKGGFIVDAEVVVGNNNEEAALIPAIDRIEEQFEEKPKQALADSGFHNGTNLSGLEDRGVEALISARQEFGNNPAIRSDATLAVEEAKRLELPMNAQSKVLDKAAFLYQEANDILIDHLRRTVLVGTELATAQVDTIRLKLLKIGAVVKTSVRRLVLHLSSAYPLQALFKLVCEKLGGLTALHIDQQTTG